MAAFPSIEPLERSYDLGSHPISASAFSNGDETRFLHSSVSSGVPLALAFRKLSLTEARQISAHWDGQGTARPFTIPVHLWRTHSSTTDVVPATFVWRYASAPEETPANGGLFDVSVSLLAVA